MGLWYGGFMVNWLVGTTDRFRAAVSENGVTNQISSWANSRQRPRVRPGVTARATRSRRRASRSSGASRRSRNVADVRTPLLMLQAEADLRCPPRDNEQFFIALRSLGRTVEYVLYPEE